MAKKKNSQATLDLEDALLRLSRLRKAIAERDHWAEEIARLRRELRQATRKHKEAGWNFSLAVHIEKNGQP